MANDIFKNPFRPGAGQLPPHLAGRQSQIDYFKDRILTQSPILSNFIISGLRGVGKTVLLDTLRPIAAEKGWLWAGSDLSESASASEKNFSTRILTDLASAVSSIVISESESRTVGYNPEIKKTTHHLNHAILNHIYNTTPGLESDKLKSVLEKTWGFAKNDARGIILAYDEAQSLIDHESDKQYPLSILLEITQYLQKKNVPYLLILTGLPTLLSNLIQSRTYAERMFHQEILTRLSDLESREAIVVPMKKENCPVQLTESAIQQVVRYSGGYPYFIQYLCKEIYDSYLQQKAMGKEPSVTLDSVIRKLDTDFYQGRWNKVTDRQRDLLTIIADLENVESGFTIKEIEAASKATGSPFKASPINLMLKALIEAGLVYKNRHGKYSFAVPMFSHFIKRELQE
jgi:hypothetical protein